MKLTFTVGKYYRTEGGHKAKCIKKNKKAEYLQFELSNGMKYATELNGVYSAYEEQEFNIVAEWNETKDAKAIIEAYEAACNNLIKAFAEKQGLEFDYFIGSFKNGWASFNETYQFQLSDIILDLNSEQSAGFIMKWFNSDEHYEHRINYNSYILARGKVLKTKETKL
jgi:hypothetical protein